MNEKPKFMCYRSFKLNDFIGFHFYRSFKLNDFVGFHFYHSFVHVSFVRSCFVHLVNNFDSKRRFLSWRFDLRITNGNTKLWFINNNSQIVWISYTSRGSNKIEGGSRSKDERNMNERWTKLLKVRSRTLFSKLISTVRRSWTCSFMFCSCFVRSWMIFTVFVSTVHQ